MQKYEGSLYAFKNIHPSRYTVPYMKEQNAARGGGGEIL